ncbi:MAG: nuclear transport factor 2 family protein [Candidatus Zixiibacteriota bacterium]|nr:MAG: nuclear transport factor 2 family protein [candidate division Zixibacteria bacterium]
MNQNNHSEGKAVSIEPNRRAIVKTIEQFFDGIRRLDADSITAIFHPRADSFSLTPRGVCIEPAQVWRDIINQVRDNPEHLFHESFSGRILDIDVVGTVGTAKVEWIFKSARIVDFYNLLKVDGNWLIVNQVYHTFVGQDT